MIRVEGPHWGHDPRLVSSDSPTHVRNRLLSDKRVTNVRTAVFIYSVDVEMGNVFKKKKTTKRSLKDPKEVRRMRR